MIKNIQQTQQLATRIFGEHMEELSVNKVTTAGKPKRAMQKVELCYRCDRSGHKANQCRFKTECAENATKLDTYKEHVGPMYHTLEKRDSTRLRK